ncbi:MAG: hypothetical protein NZP34_02185, partial [Caldilineales bacterium]|nr:hypothetical protein [Caldilineales bacterium]
MNPSPTPFTHSVVCVTLTAALKQLGVETTPIDDAFADHVAAAWGQSPGRIRHLLGRPATADEHNGPR